MTTAASWGRFGTSSEGPRGGPAALVVAVEDSSQVGEARRAAATVAADAGLSETERGAVAVIVTEMATNLARHARGGRVLISAIGSPPAVGVELLALDDGPGIGNMHRAMDDGFSTAGTAGQGLGAIRRMAHEFDVY